MSKIEKLIESNTILRRRKKYYSKYGDSNTEFFMSHFLIHNTFKVSGVYAIKQLSNDIVYIGSTNDILNRWRQHFSALNKGSHECKQLQQDFNTFGPADFTWVILEKADVLTELEGKYIEQYIQNNHKLYNKRIIDVSKNTGIVFDEVARKNMSKAQTGRRLTKETKNKISESNKGKVHSEDTKLKLKISHQGSNSSSAKLNESIVYEIKDLISRKVPLIDIAKQFEINEATISDIKNLKTWTHVIHKNDNNLKDIVTDAFKGSRNPSSKLDESDVRLIKIRITNGEQLSSIANDYGVSRTLIGHIKRGKLWSHVS